MVSHGVDGPAFTSLNDEFIETSDFAVMAPKGVDISAGQRGTSRPYDDFDLDDFHVSDDGLQWLVHMVCLIMTSSLNRSSFRKHAWATT